MAPFAPDAEALAPFAGEYDSAELDVRWRVSVDGEQLKLHPPRGEATPLSPAFPDAFTGIGLMRFQRDEAGTITGFEVDMGRTRGIAFRRLAPPAD